MLITNIIFKWENIMLKKVCAKLYVYCDYNYMNIYYVPRMV